MNKLEKMLKRRDTEFGQTAISLAKDEYVSDEIQVDDTNLAHHNGEDGWWVEGWLWVPDTQVRDQYARCANCNRLWLTSELPPAQDLSQRAAPNDEVSGECPDCGALCWPLEEKEDVS